MDHKHSVLLERLAVAREAKAHKHAAHADIRAKRAPKPDPAPQVDAKDSPPADATRQLASATAKDAMIMGWDKAIQKHGYENQVSDQRMRLILDEALAYNDKADVSGRIDELRDWRIERRGRSERSFSAGRRFG